MPKTLDSNHNNLFISPSINLIHIVMWQMQHIDKAEGYSMIRFACLNSLIMKTDAFHRSAKKSKFGLKLIDIILQVTVVTHSLQILSHLTASYFIVFKFQQFFHLFYKFVDFWKGGIFKVHL